MKNSKKYIYVANRDIEQLDIDDKIEYWHTHDTGNSLREFLGMTEQEYLDFALGKNTGEKDSDERK